AGGKAADADKLDGLDATAFLGVNQEAANSDKLDGQSSSAFIPICQTGATRVIDFCVSAAGAGTWSAAFFACANMNPAMSLPSSSELAAVQRFTGQNEEDWTSNLTDTTHAITVQILNFAQSLHEHATSDSLNYRCIATPMALGVGLEPAPRAP